MAFWDKNFYFGNLCFRGEKKVTIHVPHHKLIAMVLGVINVSSRWIFENNLVSFLIQRKVAFFDKNIYFGNLCL